MEIIQFLIKYFLSTDSGKAYAPILDAFQKNNFDLNKVIKQLDIKTLLPLITNVLGAFINNGSSFSSSNNNSTPVYNGKGNFSDIINIADKEIIYSLNKYFS